MPTRPLCCQAAMAARRRLGARRPEAPVDPWTSSSSSYGAFAMSHSAPPTQAHKQYAPQHSGSNMHDILGVVDLNAEKGATRRLHPGNQHMDMGPAPGMQCMQPGGAAYAQSFAQADPTRSGYGRGAPQPLGAPPGTGRSSIAMGLVVPGARSDALAGLMGAQSDAAVAGPYAAAAAANPFAGDYASQQLEEHGADAMEGADRESDGGGYGGICSVDYSSSAGFGGSRGRGGRLRGGEPFQLPSGRRGLHFK